MSHNRLEIVETPAGTHVRAVAANNEKVFSTEVLTGGKAGGYRACESILNLFRGPLPIECISEEGVRETVKDIDPLPKPYEGKPFPFPPDGRIHLGAVVKRTDGKDVNDLQAVANGIKKGTATGFTSDETEGVYVSVCVVDEYGPYVVEQKADELVVCVGDDAVIPPVVPAKEDLGPAPSAEPPTEEPVAAPPHADEPVAAPAEDGDPGPVPPDA